MKVFLTGASGFVGSQILEALRAQGVPTRILLRPTSNTRLIQAHLGQVEVQSGTLSEPAVLDAALAGVTHVVHCAGATKAVRPADFYAANQYGTQHLVAAINQSGGRVQRLVHLSSLAATGPALPDKPAREEDPPHPVSQYGKSKLAGEKEVQDRCRAESVILRPPAVYGPGDEAFLSLFAVVQKGLLPRFGGGCQQISLAYVKDLAGIVMTCLTHAAVAGKIYHVASQPAVTLRDLAREIALQMQVRTIPIPVPVVLLAPLCLAQDCLARITGKPGILSRDKYAELRAPAWVGGTRRFQADLGDFVPTPLSVGIAETLAWYRRVGWLR